MGAFPVFLVAILPCFVHSTFTEGILSQEFLAFEKQFNRTYSSNDERLNRNEIFKANLDQIKQHNSQDDVSYTMGINQFSDMTGKWHDLLSLLKWETFLKPITFSRGRVSGKIFGGLCQDRSNSVTGVWLCRHSPKLAIRCRLEKKPCHQPCQKPRQLRVLLGICCCGTDWKLLVTGNREYDHPLSPRALVVYAQSNGMWGNWRLPWSHSWNGFPVDLQFWHCEVGWRWNH